MKQFIDNLNEPKSKIGFAHGTLTILGAIMLGFLTMMVFSKFMIGDNAFKIMPSILLTPVIISLYAILLLYSRTLLACLSKLFILSAVLIIIIEVF